MLRIPTFALLICFVTACIPIQRSPATTPDLVTGIATPEDAVRQLEAQQRGLSPADITIDAMRDFPEGPLIFYTAPSHAYGGRQDRQ